jgi:hypothetical protein
MKRSMTEEYLRTLVPSILGSYRKTYGLRDVPIAVDHLRPMIEERGWVDRIVWEEFDFPSKHIKAQVQFYKGNMGVYSGQGDYARIQYSSSLNFCWQRFAICKEMFHAFIDKNPKDRITTTPDLLKLAEMIVSDSSAFVQDFSPFDTEQSAEVLAVETLFPFELRERYEDRYRAGEISDRQLATRFRIPEDYARQAMYPSYFESIRDVRRGTLVDY